MKLENLKRYVVLSNGNQINQDYQKLTEKDVVQKGKDLYVIYNDYVLDGKTYPFNGIAKVVYTCQTEKTLSNYLKTLFSGGELYFDAIKQCIASINAYCEHHIKKTEDLYNSLNKKMPPHELDFYKGMHHAMEKFKDEMSHQLVWRNNKIEYFGQGGTLKKQKWYDTPFGYNKDKIYW